MVIESSSVSRQDFPFTTSPSGVVTSPVRVNPGPVKWFAELVLVLGAEGRRIVASAHSAPGVVAGQASKGAPPRCRIERWDTGLREAALAEGETLHGKCSECVGRVCAAMCRARPQGCAQRGCGVRFEPGTRYARAGPAPSCIRSSLCPPVSDS